MKNPVKMNTPQIPVTKYPVKKNTVLTQGIANLHLTPLLLTPPVELGAETNREGLGSEAIRVF